jgi:adenylate cyclase
MPGDNVPRGGRLAARSHSFRTQSLIAPIDPLRYKGEDMRRLRAAILVAFLGWLSALALDLLGVGERLELLTLDARYATGIGRAAPSDEVVIAWIDQESLEFAARDGMGFPWPRTLYEEVLGYLRECGAKVVAFDLLFDQISSPDTDRAFGAALATRPDTVLVAKLVTFRQGAATAAETARYRERGLQSITLPSDRPTAPGVVLPLPELEQGAAKVGFSNVAADTDRTHRHYDLVRAFQPSPESAAIPVPSFALASVLAARPDFDVAHALRHGARRLLGFRGGEFTFAKVKVVNIVQSMMAVADGRTPRYGKEQFEDRIVLVGIHADGLEDAHPTPLSRAFPGVELHATAIDNLLRDDFLREVGFAPAFAATASALAALAVFAFPGVLAPVLALLVLVASMVGGALVAWQSHVAVPLALPLVAGGATSAFGFAWRLWSEGRQKREMRRAFASYVAPEVLAEVLANLTRGADAG